MLHFVFIITLFFAPWVCATEVKDAKGTKGAIPLAFPDFLNTDVTRMKVVPTKRYIEEQLERPLSLTILHNKQQLSAYCQRELGGLIIWPDENFAIDSCQAYQPLMVAAFSLHLYHYHKGAKQPHTPLHKEQLLAQMRRIGIIKHTHASDVAGKHFKDSEQVELVWFGNFFEAFKALTANTIDVIAAANILPAALGERWQNQLISIKRFEEPSHTGLYVHQDTSLQIRKRLLDTLDGRKISAEARARINLGVTSYRPVSYNSELDQIE